MEWRLEYSSRYNIDKNVVRDTRIKGSNNHSQYMATHSVVRHASPSQYKAAKYPSQYKAAKYPPLRRKRGIARCFGKILGVICEALHFIFVTRLYNISIV
jgi:hypothetical protein